jgi:hypothetical protein
MCLHTDQLQSELMTSNGPTEHIDTIQKVRRSQAKEMKALAHAPLGFCTLLGLYTLLSLYTLLGLYTPLEQNLTVSAHGIVGIAKTLDV